LGFVHRWWRAHFLSIRNFLIAETRGVVSQQQQMMVLAMQQQMMQQQQEIQQMMMMQSQMGMGPNPYGGGFY
jgi:hypothetical protein